MVTSLTVRTPDRGNDSGGRRTRVLLAAHGTRLSPRRSLILGSGTSVRLDGAGEGALNVKADRRRVGRVQTA